MLGSLLSVLWESFIGTLNYYKANVLFEVPWFQNYFYGLILISLVIWGLEIAFPWRKDQKVFRKDFFLDLGHMFFNFFLFSAAISGFYALLENGFGQFGVHMKSMALFSLDQLPQVAQLLLFFIVLDFVQWLTHVALHRFEWLWRFHQVHHSVKEMGFAAHFRYHWMENILYKPLKTLAVMLLGGFEPEQAYIIHFVAITIGHLNHSNLGLTYGPFKYLLNNPVMHLYHHAKALPETHKYGVNFGISLSVWDYLFRSSFVPRKEAHLELGYEGDEQMPKGFIAQHLYGFKKAQ